MIIVASRKVKGAILVALLFCASIQNAFSQQTDSIVFDLNTSGSGSCLICSSLYQCNPGNGWTFTYVDSAAPGLFVSNVDVVVYYTGCDNAGNVQVKLNDSMVGSFGFNYSCQCSDCFIDTISRAVSTGFPGYTSGDTNVLKIQTSNNMCVAKVVLYLQYYPPAWNDAGITSLDTLGFFCSGNKDLYATVQNFGKNQIDSVTVNWSFNDTAQTSVHIIGTLDTFGGSGSTDTMVFLGTKNLSNASGDAIKVWSSDPNGVTDTTNLNDTLEMDLKPSMAGNYTIGGSSPDYTTIANAITDVMARGVCGPVVFKIRTGTYTDQLTINTIPGVDSTSTVTFESETGDSTDVLVTYFAASSAANWVVRLNSTRYVNFQKIHFEATGTSYARVFDLNNNASHVSISNCVISGPYANSGSNRAGIYSDDQIGPDNIKIRNNVIKNGGYGIYLYASYSTHMNNILIENNQFIDQYNYSCYLVYVDDVQVVGNNFNNFFTYWDGLYLDECYNFIVASNRFNMTYGGEALSIYAGGGTSGNPSLIANNFITISSSNGGTGIYARYTEYTDIVFNSMNIVAGNYSYAFEISNNDYMNVINNNVVSDEWIYYAWNNYASRFDYNNLYSRSVSAGSFAYDGNQNHSDLASWKNATGLDSSSLNQDPNYASVTELRTKNIDLKSGGTSYSQVLVDIDGEARDTLTPDIGADEFVPNSLDASLLVFSDISLMQPDVQVLAKNNGSDTITSLKIGWMNGVITQSTVNWSGSLPSGDSVWITLDSLPYTYDSSYNLTAWSFDPNATTDSFTANDTISGPVAYALAGVYTIGGSSPDFLGFTKALNALKAGGIADTVLFNVRDSTYVEQLLFPRIKGTDMGHSITFQSEQGDSSGVILSFAPPYNANYILGFDEAKNLKFHQIKLKTTGTTYSQLIYFSGGSGNIEFSNCHLEGRAVTTSSTNNTLVYKEGDRESRDLRFVNNYFYLGSNAVYFYGYSSSNKDHRTVFMNNRFEGQYYRAVYTRYQDTFEFTGNVINSTTSFGSGLYGFYGYNLESHFKILKNRIYGNIGQALYINSCNLSYGDTGLIANNFITTNNSGYSYSITLQSNSYLTMVYNNVLRTTNTSSEAVLLVQSNSNLLMANNNFINSSTGYAIYTSSSYNQWSYLDHNNYFTNGNYLAYYGAQKDTLGAWQAATGLDSHSISINPEYLSGTDLHVENVGLNKKGVSIVGVSDDIDGDLRDSIPDIGADEFSPPANDADLTRFTVPGATFLADTVYVEVMMRNSGLDSLKSVSLHWVVNNDTQSVVNWTGKLDTEDSAVVQLGYYVFNDTTAYTITAWTKSPNGMPDDKTSNDTVVIVNRYTSLSGVYTIGGSTPDYPDFKSAVHALITRGVSDSVLFNVRNGTYYEHIRIPKIAGANFRGQIIFQAESGDSTDVTLSYQATNIDSNYVILLEGAEYLLFRKLTLLSSSVTSYASVIVFRNEASHNSFMNNRVVGAASTSTSTYGSLVLNQNEGGESNEFVGNHFQNGSYGIYFSNSSSQYHRYLRVVNNRFENTHYRAIYTTYNLNPHIINNRIDFTNSSRINAIGIYMEDCDDSLRIERNWIYHPNQGIGIMMYYCGRNISDTGYVVNNIISLHNMSNGYYAIYLYNPIALQVMHNTVRISGNSTGSYVIYSAYASANRLLNNILINEAGGYIYYFPSGMNFSIMDHNVLVANGMNLAYLNGTNYKDLSEWQSGTSNDTASVIEDPFFISDLDLHARNIDLNGKAVPLPFVTNDIDGDARSSAPDLGADEFDPPLLDAGVEALLNPVIPFVSDTIPVVVAVKNYGSQTITAFKLFWEINGILDSMVWNDTLLTADTAQVTVRNFYFDPDSIYTIRSWTSIPNGIPDTANYNDTFTLMNLASALTGIYTIGGVAPDFNTFTEAITAMITGGIVDSVRFDVRSGTYKERIAIPEIQGVSGQNSIIFQSENQDSTLVTLKDSALNSVSNYVIHLNEAQGVTFRHMTLKASASNYGRVVWISNGASNNGFFNNRLEGSALSTTSTNNTIVYSESTLDTSNQFLRNYFLDGSIGLYLNGPNSSTMETGMRIENNHFKDQYYAGMMLNYLSEVQVHNNTIETSSPYTGFYGLYGNYIYPVKITGNRIYGGVGNLPFALYRSYNYFDDHGVIANNFISRKGTSSNTVVYLYRCNYVDFVFNNILDSSSSVSSSALYTYQGSNVTARNNILFSSNGYALYRVSSGLNNSDHNDLYTGGTNIGYYNGARTDLTAWQNATGLDVNSISTDPLYTSLTDLHVSSVDLNGAGSPFTGITTDIDNEERDTLIPDIGADEFRIPAEDDAGISDLIGPVSPFVAGNRAVQLEIKNHGSDTLKSATVHWKVNGNTQSSFAWTGNLSTGKTDTFVVGSFNFLDGIFYTIESWTTSPNGQADTINWNDSLTSSGIIAGLDGIYTIGGVAPDFASFSDAISVLMIAGVVDTVEFQVRTGTYNEQVTLSGFPGAAVNRPVTFTSEDSDSTKVVLQYNSPYTDDYIFRLDNVSHVNIRQLTIKSLNTYYTKCIVLQGGSDHINILNNRIEGVYNSYGSGALIYSGSTTEEYIRIQNNHVSGGYMGIALYGQSSSFASREKGNIIAENILTSQRNYAILVSNQNGIRISGNRVTSLNTSSDFTGISVYNSHDTTSIMNNIVTDASTTGYFAGLYVSSVERTLAVYPLVANNMISSGRNSSFGMRFYNCSELKIFYNSVNLYGLGAGNKYAVYFQYNAGFQLINNILSNPGGGYALYNQDNQMNLAISNYNDLYTSGTNLVYFNGNNYTTLNAWIVAVSRDAQSISNDPRFVSNTNLHAYISSLDGQALAVSEVTTDFEGNLRDSVAPDIGADEFNSLPNNIGISMIHSPFDGCEMDSAEVSVDVFNYGSLSQTGFDVVYRMNGGSAVTQNFGTTDTLDPGMSTVFTFTKKQPVSTGNTYQFTIFSNLSNDQDRSDDTTGITISNFSEPDTVRNMVPADSSINQDFPLTLSWSPVTGATKYDVYVWQDGSSRPSVPLRSGLVSISTTIYQYDLIVLYGKSYKWQVKAYNAYCHVWSDQNLFTVKELPDLTVSSISSPASAFSGTNISVGWSVQNDSTGVTGSSSWYDFIYLSIDSVLDGTDIYASHKVNKTALLQGQSYANSATISIPNGYIGTVYIIVSTDHYNQLNEKDNTNNKRSRSIPISLTPPPDLQVTSIIKPTQAYSGTSIQVQWTVTNNGSGGSVSSQWYDRVYLSSDSTISNDDVYFGVKKRLGVLQKDSSYTTSLNGTIPVNYSGNYYIIVQTDIYGQVYEHASESNNTSISDSIKVILAPPPDFMATTLVHPDSASNKTWITLNYAIENNGVGDNYVKTWYDQIFISNKSTFIRDSSILLKTMYRSGTISGFGAIRYNENILIPSILNGNHYLYVVTDVYNHIYEYDKENNNTSAGSLIKVVSPDLVVRNIQLPISDSSGKTIAVSYHIKNIGNGDLVGTYLQDSFYISSDSNLYSGAVPLGVKGGNTSISSGDSIQRTAFLTIPNGLSGTRYFHIVTDRPGSIYEAGMDHNNASWNSMNVVLTPWPDLVIDSLYIAVDTVASGDTIKLHFTVRNNGIGPARTGHKNEVYLSIDTLLGLNDTKLGTYIYLDTLGKDSTYSVVMDIVIPKTTNLGNYRFLLRLDSDNDLYEHQREGNNNGSSGSLHIKGYPPVDLIAGCLHGKDSVISGNTYMYTWDVTNIGEATTPVSYWTDYFYISEDTILDYTDQAIGQLIINEILDVNESYQAQLNLTIPNGLQGYYYLFLYTDGADRNNDVNKANNARMLCDQNDDPVQFRIDLAPTADLVIGSLSVPSNATAGQPFKVYYSVGNEGIAKTALASWADRLYLSSDFTIGGGDYILGTRTHGGKLDVDSVYSDSMEVTVPVNLFGNYVILIKTDANNVLYEHNGENNNTDAGAILVSQAPPADLVVVDVTTTDSVGTGDNMLVNWTIRNDGSNPAVGTMWDHLYLSEDTTWDVSDILIGSRFRGINLIPSATANQSLSVEVSSVSLGSYYVIVRTDIKNNINESNDNNNEGASDSVKVNVPELPLNVWTPDTILNGDDIGYRIEIPLALNDESLLIELKADSVNGSNEIFLKYGQMATGADNDFSYSDPFAGNQEITVPELDYGTYYLLVRGTSPGGSQPSNIRPRILDFEVRSVDANQGGNNGKVTVLIDGSKFDSTTVFHLTSNTDTITSIATYYVDPTRMYATFDLEARKVGKYNLVAEKENGETAIRYNCFDVVPGTPADLQINVRKPSGARTNRVVAMIVEITNSGNTDITAKELTLNSPIGAPVSFDMPGLDDDLDVLLLKVEEENGPPGILRAGGSASIVVYTYTSAALGFNIIIPDLND